MRSTSSDVTSSAHRSEEWLAICAAFFELAAMTGIDLETSGSPPLFVSRVAARKA